MSLLPLITEISDAYPNPSNAVARAGFAKLWNAVNEFQQKSEIDLASAATCDIGGQASTKLRITGTTGITSFGTNYRGPILIRWAGAVSITNNATTLRCPGGANYTTTANEVMIAWPIASVSGTLDGWQLGALSGGSLIGTAAITGGSITGITDLSIADGGTGASTASAAFTALKQAADTSTTGVVELATDTEALAGTDTIRAVTSAGLASAKSYASSGYQKLPGGLILQWGAAAGGVDVNSAGTTITATFPLSFPTACYQVIPGIFTGDSGNARFLFVDWTGATTSQATFLVWEGVGTVQSSWNVTYFAIGR